MKDSFSKLNPFVLLFFFIFAIGFSMFIDEPICLVMSFFSALICCLQINGKKTLRLCFVYILPLSIILIILNPIFNHQGVTILGYFPWGNPLTLESLIYGIVPCVVLASVMLWFSVFNTVMTSDKIMYLFGKLAPSLSLLISMALRFVPKFSQELSKTRKAQKCIGCDVSDGSVLMRIKNAVKILSIMITRSMEEAVETADSMKSRGYGLKGRTTYAIYTFDRKDAVALAVILILGCAMLTITLCGCFEFYYFPMISSYGTGFFKIMGHIVYLFLLTIPLILNVEEGLRWKLSRSKI